MVDRAKRAVRVSAGVYHTPAAVSQGELQPYFGTLSSLFLLGVASRIWHTGRNLQGILEGNYD